MIFISRYSLILFIFSSYPLNIQSIIVKSIITISNIAIPLIFIPPYTNNYIITKLFVNVFY
nr:MAG TPA: hypothetical protein [Caudoviricetes sp.]